MISVGLLGATGYMGASFCAGLLKAHCAGELKLIVLHQPQSKLSKYPKEVEKREIDLENDSISKISDTVKDLHVVMQVIRANNT